jgi:hypothetical protein
MKKIILTLAVLLAVGVTNGFAAPINDLTTGQTAVGIGSDTFYLENKIVDNFTIGYQNIYRGDYGHMDDIYGQLNFGKNLRGIVGSRDFGSDSKLYGGLAVTAPLANKVDGYVSFVGGGDFQEFQVGANYKLTKNVDLNVNYYSFMPDESVNQDGVGIGVTLKF